MPEPLIDLNPNHWQIVRDLLQKHLAGYEVWAFGSRAKWQAKETSDLDLAVITPQPLPSSLSAAIAEDFSESDLPFKVDVVDWATTSPSFRKIIESQKVVVQEKRKGLVMASKWRSSNWGDEVVLKYGKATRGYSQTRGKYRVFGSNGPIGWISDALTKGPGVVLGRKGAYRGVEFCREPFWVIDTAYYLVPKTALDMRWLYYAVKHYKLGEVDDGSPIPSTTRAAVYMLPLDIPPLPEQRAIAHILGTFDDKIELNRQMNETLEAIAQALFKSWFVDFDPVRAKQQGLAPQGMDEATAALFPESFEDSELGPIPKGWNTIPVYELATYINGAAYKAFEPNSECRGLPIIKIAELKSGVTAQTMYSDVAMPEKYRIKSRDILFSWSGNPDTSIDTFIWFHGQAWLNQHIFKVVPHVAETRSFVLQMLKHLRPIFAELARNKQTTGLGHVTVADMKRLRVIQPHEVIMNLFSLFITPLHEKIFENVKQSRTLAALRDALLPKLISGQLRVPEAEALASEIA